MSAKRMFDSNMSLNVQNLIQQFIVKGGGLKFIRILIFKIFIRVMTFDKGLNFFLYIVRCCFDLEGLTKLY